VLAFFSMARELDEHRTSLRRLEDRLRNVEEAIKLLALEQRHAREIEQAEREKWTVRLESLAPKSVGVSRPKRKKK
jgi:hypothetical protein